MNYLQDLVHLFFPKICITCESKLLQSEKIICTLCRHDLPIICYKDYKDNKITKAFYGRIPIEKASSFLFYRKEGKTKDLIHALKYKGNQEVGVFIGDWLGNILKDSNEFADIDCIIPVPLHPKKLKKRGYNQLTTFGLSLSKHLEKPYLEDVLIRTSASKTQTFKQRFERFSNNDTKFSVPNSSTLKNKHILLIDDVITTGATLESCCKELLIAENSKISIVTMAYTE
ncbi:Amidophosphoribosyltransferase [Polaribacter huanghezhanensis]|uniref:ComF family protein n=1 Tax=Polaribacter huanghezhanensis TaxID=1354726 RepID=UPI0026477AB0|nr:phosphoribosyltransferase family protein [Polaribacter huanghezhanensis]WKD85137.1 Amidophosphoribosyltransferase [Polaribacter huanghezhanensis]